MAVTRLFYPTELERLDIRISALSSFHPVFISAESPKDCRVGRKLKSARAISAPKPSNVGWRVACAVVPGVEKVTLEF
jgi:hypothetical protein